MSANGHAGPILTIGFDADGAVQVNGPLNDKVLCYGLLAMAGDAIKDFNDARAEPKIAPASHQDVIALSSKRNRS